ncbi:MAG: VCBS repeat-containing protein [Planctomycetes bacterium]|nr:VCBS repeat-containing protein [Planctomycetota bacterium]
MAEAFILRVYSVQEILDASKVVVEAEIESVDAESRTAVARVSRTLKGECDFQQIKMNIGIGQSWFPQALMQRLAVGKPALFFYDIQNQKLACLGHAGGVWFQLFGDLQPGPGRVWWQFTHIEVHLNRTFSGSTQDLRTLVADVLAGRRASPAADTKLPALTREDLLGRNVPAGSTPAGPAAGTAGVFAGPDEPDALEAFADWRVETWGNPAEVKASNVTASRGVCLEVRYRGGPHDKIAVSRTLAADLTQAGRFLFDARQTGEQPIRIAWALTTEPDAQFFESAPIVLPPGPWVRDIDIGLLSRSFKCAASDWDLTSPLLHRHRVSRLTLLVYDAPENGSLLIDRLRPDRGSLFVRSIPLAHTDSEACSVSWSDYDGDGDLDALVGSTAGNRLFRNDLGDFTDATADAGIRGGSRCASWADYDADGDPDLFDSTPALWTNDQGRFRNDAALLPPLAPLNPEGAGWLDANGDGCPDILLTQGEHGIHLFLNQSRGPRWFEDASVSWGLGPKGLGAGNGDFLALADFDADGFPDFLYNLGRGLLARNDDGHCFRIADRSGIDYPCSNEHKLGVAFGDFDHDEDLDLFVPQKDRSRLFRNNNNLTFTEVTDRAGDLSNLPGQARTAAWADLNADGLLDLVVGFTDQPLRLYLQEGDGRFADHTCSSGLDRFPWTHSATGIACADFDGDGDLDILVTGEETTSGILVSQPPRSLARRPALRLRLPPSCAPGVLVRVQDSSGQSLGLRFCGLVQNFCSQEPPEVFLALVPGRYRFSVLLTSGDLLEKEVLLGASSLRFDLGPGVIGPDDSSAGASRPDPTGPKAALETGIRGAQ